MREATIDRKTNETQIAARLVIDGSEDIAALQEMGIHAAVGMAAYTGRLNLARLAMMNAADRAR